MLEVISTLSKTCIWTIGRGGPIHDIERFVCKLYKAPEAPSIDHTRHLLFSKCQKAIETLPPTKDALELHIARANLQAKIWLQADRAHMTNVSPDESIGWRQTESSLDIVWTRLQPVPNTYLQLVTCGCKTKCSTA